jgi:DNA-binding transcriptional LysR family regulator
VDLDLAQVRAFVAAAEELHFGRAAVRLFLSQQVLSKRIARLEEELGVLLFSRAGHAVELTEAGQRFLPPARQILTDGDRAVAAARHTSRPLRIDVWGHLYGPMRTVSPVIEDLPQISTEIGASRDLPAAMTALLRSEIDAAFRRVHSFPAHAAERLSSRLARLEPVDAVVSTEHPLAGQPQARPADLQDSTLWCPAALDRLDFLRHFAERFGIPVEEGGANLGLDHLIDRIRATPQRLSLLPRPRTASGRGRPLSPAVRPNPAVCLVTAVAPPGSAPAAGHPAGPVRRNRAPVPLAQLSARRGLAAAPGLRRAPAAAGCGLASPCARRPRLRPAPRLRAAADQPGSARPGRRA